jgi:hypothetical protein
MRPDLQKDQATQAGIVSPRRRAISILVLSDFKGLWRPLQLTSSKMGDPHQHVGQSTRNRRRDR